MFAFGTRPPAWMAVDVGGDHADAVGVVALEVREDEVLGGLTGVLLGARRPRRKSSWRKVGEPAFVRISMRALSSVPGSAAPPCLQRGGMTRFRA